MILFQSAPAITGGRSHSVRIGFGQPYAFQSAPAITGGRSPSATSQAAPGDCFNPRPPSLAGDPGRAGPLVQPHGRFNPRPPSLAGDPTRFHRRHRPDDRFNPRPPSLAGDPRAGCWVGPGLGVSIRARHHWRAIRRPARSIASSKKFQSAPAITGGRSPRAGARWRGYRRFQSAPAITGGRSRSRTRGRCLHSCFNPRPPSLAGDPTGAFAEGVIQQVSIRARHHWRAIHHFQGCQQMITHVSIRARHHWRAIHPPGDPAARHRPVSIRARHHWRAIPQQLARCQAARTCFNPRPPSLAGDPPAPDQAGRPQVVSIRARHHWRAIPSSAPGNSRSRPFQSAPAITGGRSTDNLLGLPRILWFQSAPAITGGRSTHSILAKKQVLKFQSAPAITGGRSAQPAPQPCAPDRFNPRPPSLAGDPRAQRRFIYLQEVSIRARHHWRAIQAVAFLIGRAKLFQSAPAITGGRSPISSCRATRSSMFQSAPAITGGRSSGPSALGRPPPLFQSAPAITGGRSVCDLVSRLPLTNVSIRARHHWRAIRQPARAPLA